MKRIGMLTSGGDCQALNATMRGVSKALYRAFPDEVEIIGFEDGYRGLIYGDYRQMKPEIFPDCSPGAARFWEHPDSRLN